jgi:hypothetical protein
MDEQNKKTYREFTVTPGMVGFKVKIGCSEAYFGDKDGVRQAICNYLNDPEEAEKFYLGLDMRNQAGMLAGTPENRAQRHVEEDRPNMPTCEPR